MGRRPYDRSLLLGPKRNEVLELSEIEQYGIDTFGDADYVSVYGLKPRVWYERGVRLLGRTAVECTRDRLAEQIVRDVAEVVRASERAVGWVVDPFAGSANTLYWLTNVLGPRHAVGFDADAGVYAATARNLACLGIEIALRRDAFPDGLEALAASSSAGELLIAFVAPPWGDALDPATGLDLRRTTPPVLDVIDELATRFPGHEAVVAVQTFETVVPASLSEILTRFEWHASHTYAIDPPGRNHALLLGSVGFAPHGDAFDR
jgi:hypothetical protein